MLSIITIIESIIRWIGEKSSYINVLLVMIICIDVFMRYILNTTQTWVIELEWHLFALIFLLGASYTLQEDQHVRVDLFYADRSNKSKAWINLAGTLLFLVPWCLILINSSFNYATNSWMMNEGSPNPGGLPARYIIKYFMTFGFVLLLLQGIAVIYRSVQTIFSSNTKSA
ncbi:MAG TPA: C4-dicarboxylate ABC transporter permease [Saprospirales bacterium]|jgi:TRAP-type mannitol/chloroaromatic compound transport system permease small subunit|nr:C4-dicarboxylate ABC transporter permease [Saprospirales bacterium]